MQNIQQIVYTHLNHKERLKKLIEEDKHLTLLKEWEGSLKNGGEIKYFVEIKADDGLDLFLLGFGLACEIVSPIQA